MIGSAGMGTCMLLSAIFVGTSNSTGKRGLGYAAAVVLYIFHSFVSIFAFIPLSLPTHLSDDFLVHAGMAEQHVDLPK